MHTSEHRRWTAGILAAIAIAITVSELAPAATTQPADPALGQKQADEFLAKLAENKRPDEKTLQEWVDKLSESAYKPLHAALISGKLPKDQRDRLEDVFPAIVRKLNPWMIQAPLDRKWEADFSLKAYDQFGMKDPKWDGLVRAAFQLWGQTPPGGVFKREDNLAIVEAMERAINAGCKDPIVVHHHLAAKTFVDKGKHPEWRTMMLGAADAMEATKYPAWSKFNAYIFALRLVQGRAEDQATDKAMITHLFDVAMAEWKSAVKSPEIPDHVLFDRAKMLMAGGKAMGMQEDRVAQLVIKPLEAVRDRAVTDILEGQRLLDEAWSSRGSGWASEVTPERMGRAVSQAQTARKHFEQAWLKDPGNVIPPIRLMQIEMLDHRGRAMLEKWYQRAIAAYPSSNEARGQKLTYLLPEWYGSYKEMIEFGRECLATNDWKGKIPLLLLTVHREIEQKSGKGPSYYKDPAVWKDVEAVLQSAVKYDPKDYVSHSYYAYYAAITDHKEIARAEFEILGDNASVDVFGSQTRFEELRKASGFSRKSAGTRPAVLPGLGAPVKQPVSQWLTQRLTAGKGGMDFAMKFVDDEIKAKENFQLYFGSDIIKGAKPTILFVRYGQLFTFELKPEQTKLIPQYNPKMLGGHGTAAKGAVLTSKLARVRDLVLENKGPWDTSSPLAGKFTLDVTESLPVGEYAIRICCVSADAETIKFLNFDTPPAKGSSNQSFKAEMNLAMPGLVGIFVDFVRFHGDENDVGDQASNAIGAIVEAAPSTKK